jgi:hypothetical protein
LKPHTDPLSANPPKRSDFSIPTSQFHRPLLPTHDKASNCIYKRFPYPRSERISVAGNTIKPEVSSLLPFFFSSQPTSSTHFRFPPIQLPTATQHHRFSAHSLTAPTHTHLQYINTHSHSHSPCLPLQLSRLSSRLRASMPAASLKLLMVRSY